MDIDALVDSLPEPVVNLISELQTEVTTLQKALDDATSDGDPEPEPEPDPVAKALADPEVARILKEKDERLAEVEKALEETRIAKADEVFIAKSRAFDGVVDDPNTFGPMLRQINDTNPEFATLIEKTLKQASERVRLSDLFSEHGQTGGAGAGSAYEQATAIAKSKVEAGVASDIEAARADVWEENPALFAQYQSERQAR